MPPPNGQQIGIQNILETLVNNDMRFELMLSSLIELLKTKNLEGTGPIITEEEFMKKVNEAQAEMAKQMAIVKAPANTIIRPIQ